jgi:hypothetical protein
MWEENGPSYVSITFVRSDRTLSSKWSPRPGTIAPEMDPVLDKDPRGVIDQLSSQIKCQFWSGNHIGSCEWEWCSGGPPSKIRLKILPFNPGLERPVSPTDGRTVFLEYSYRNINRTAQRTWLCYRSTESKQDNDRKMCSAPLKVRSSETSRPPRWTISICESLICRISLSLNLSIYNMLAWHLSRYRFGRLIWCFSPT